ncbi:hypothetical protein QCN27_15670 [Cereibacter sp. SYSU M97828]|nr:hypothetical protein [Cereibacter flavus]
MQANITVDQVFAENMKFAAEERCLPWEETRDGVTVVVEPKLHFESDMTVWHLSRHAFAHYRHWKRDGANVSFFEHGHKTGDQVMMDARCTIIREIETGEWA